MSTTGQGGAPPPGADVDAPAPDVDAPRADADETRIEGSYPKDRTTLGGPRLGPVGWARWTWRQLTSMRTALLLLLLLAVAAVPGSIFPQRGVDAARVRRYVEEHPDLAPWLDRLGMFDVYASPWFASIYLLLMVSLIGCIIPRTRQHLEGVRAEPPRTPRRLERLPVHRHTRLDATPEEVLAAARASLGRRRFRLRQEEDGALVVAAEKGYLKETGNIVFHLAILGVIVSVAVGHLLGWRGEIIVKERETFTSGAGTFDTLSLGPLVDEGDLPVFSLRLDDLDVEFESEAGGAQFGQPRVFSGVVTVQQGQRAARAHELAVNAPLAVDGTSVYLLGNGYAPVVTVRDAAGEVVYQDAVTFLPQDNTYSSTGAIKVTGTEPNLGFVGGFYPTLDVDPQLGMASSFPGLADPALVLTAFEGELFPEGRPQSVFSIDTASMDQVLTEEGDPFSVALRPGQTVELPGGRGTIELESVIRWGGLLVRSDPGRLPALAFASLALVGLVLMLGVRRRRVFVRVEPRYADAPAGADLAPGRAGHTGVTVAALARGTDPGLDELVEELLGQVVAASGGREVPDDARADGTDKDGQ